MATRQENSRQTASERPLRQVWYHAGCSDGFGAALAAWLKFGDLDTKYFPVQYKEPMPSAVSGDDIYILDFSYKADELLALARAVYPAKVTVLDHHQTAAQELTPERFFSLSRAVVVDEMCDWKRGFRAENLSVTFSDRKSGCVLAWEYFQGTDKPVPIFFRYLQDRDLWQWRLEKSREVNAAIRSYPQTFDKWLCLSDLMSDGAAQSEAVAKLAEEGEVILRSQRQLVAQMRTRVQFARFDTMNRTVTFMPTSANPKDPCWCPCANTSVLQSEVAEALLEDWPSSQMSAVYFDMDGKRVWSLRSRPEFDCSTVAKAFGGGGHKCASGFVETR
jgi:oligoribonuclease NrnB/cAMP/cGMP phosphodiesterase (DHH superfamily)